MTRFAFICATAGLFCEAAFAESLVATRTIRSQAIITPSDLALVSKAYPGALQTTQQAIGMEARVMLFAGRPIHPSDIGPAALVERNQIVSVVFSRGGLTITTEARAMGRGGVGDAIRVMNLGSRNTVTGQVMSDGTVRVGASNVKGTSN